MKLYIHWHWLKNSLHLLLLNPLQENINLMMGTIKAKISSKHQDKTSVNVHWFSKLNSRPTLLCTNFTTLIELKKSLEFIWIYLISYYFSKIIMMHQVTFKGSSSFMTTAICLMLVVVFCTCCTSFFFFRAKTTGGTLKDEHGFFRRQEIFL